MSEGNQFSTKCRRSDRSYPDEIIAHGLKNSVYTEAMGSSLRRFVYVMLPLIHHCGFSF